MSRLMVGALVLAGCAPRQVTFQVSIQSSVCDATQDAPFKDAQFLKLSVTAPDLQTPYESVAPISGDSNTLNVADIPAGKARVIEVRVYDAEPGTGRVISVGRSLPQDIPDVIPDQFSGQPVQINVFLRRVGVFTPVSSSDNPNQCQTMLNARAGHTATLLDDGRVFITGGYQIKGDTKVRQAIADVEVFDPATSTFRQLKTARMELKSGAVLPKAFHTATKMQNGQVLLWGGEEYSASATSTFAAPVTAVLVFDPTPEVEAFGGIPSRTTPPNIARSRHAAVLDPSGKVVVVGGMTRKSNAYTAVEEVEWYDPDRAQVFVVDGVNLPRQGAAALSVNTAQGDFIAVVGGNSDTAMSNEIAFLSYNGTTFVQHPLTPAPRIEDPGRSFAGATTYNDRADVMLVGGYGDAAGTQPLNSSEIVIGSSVSNGPVIDAPRAEVCTVTLPDGSIFAVGGLTASNGGGPLYADNHSSIVKPNAMGGAAVLGGPNLPVARHSHTCTLLADGSVLVLGGANQQMNGSEDVLNDAWIYMPAPADQ